VGRRLVRSPIFFLIAIVVGAIVFGLALSFRNDYVFFAGYVVLQYIVLATAWNVLGGYCGYVNFGSAAFFALGAYSSVALHKFNPMKAVLEICLGRFCSGEFSFAFLAPLFPFPVPALVVIGGIVSGVVGLGMGYLTLRLRGAFFAIATLALAVVLQTMIINWDYVGGSRGAYIIRPNSIAIGGLEIGYIQYLFLIMIVLSVIAVTTARLIERSRLGYGFATIRDDELAAEACGVPTLRLKLIATTISGALMGMAGAPLPYYIGYLEPGSAFNLAYGVNSIAMPMIGGTTSWIGPLIGAILLGTLQQVATVTISSAVNLLIVGFLLIGFVIMAPNGVVGLVKEFLRAAAPSRLDANALGLLLIASYCFLVGLGGVVLGLSAAMSSKSAVFVGMGVCSLALSLIYLASAYGLLKLESWSPLLTTAALAISIPLSLLYIWMDNSPLNIILEAIGIAFAIAAIWYLQNRNVKRLYRPMIEQ
jgi:branched-chain amino acid transport system permease protein